MHCRLLLIVFVLIISTYSTTFASTTSEKFPCFFLVKWHMFVINDISEDIVVHVRSRRGADLGNHTIPHNGIYDWTFCETGQSLFTGEFW